MTVNYEPSRGKNPAFSRALGPVAPSAYLAFSDFGPIIHLRKSRQTIGENYS